MYCWCPIFRYSIFLFSTEMSVDLDLLEGGFSEDEAPAPAPAPVPVAPAPTPVHAAPAPPSPVPADPFYLERFFAGLGHGHTRDHGRRGRARGGPCPGPCGPCPYPGPCGPCTPFPGPGRPLLFGEVLRRARPRPHTRPRPSWSCPWWPVQLSLKCKFAVLKSLSCNVITLLCSLCRSPDATS